MTHGEGWHFIELGRYLERASATAALLEVQFRECEWTADEAAGRQRVRRVGRPAQVVLRLRSLLPALHRRRAAAAHRRVPGAEHRFPALDPLRRRRASRRRCAALGGMTGRVNGHGRSPRRAAPARRSTTVRLLERVARIRLRVEGADEILSDLPSFLQGIGDRPMRSTRPCTSSTSPTRSTADCEREDYGPRVLSPELLSPESLVLSP